MLSELKSFSLKGLPNSEKEPNPTEFNFHVRSTLELGDDCENELSQIEDSDHGDVSKTPTSSDCRIPETFQCPPAPRKRKSLPSTNWKSPRRRVLLDLSNEVETLFPPALAANLGGKIKKVRQGNDTK
ncbi:CYCLIN-DEPENDENT PROTEIN KINASE INHIBITOR SMR2-LIKE [Salix koriyanagi]|uniref:CYCLIN-DEPENDENT PROTEIN KINASE INHIBITOR SMR2-LIKE n=1 Tax=Salix koriyanagi TaxID=2511006 RepID=A0A9Q0X2Y3_9ROSI|nr:CYCLIN-DEPENDENT PROTEIN KINASE INHIBITOR SMR2-LIKE [Salix koriyanagi]